MWNDKAQGFLVDMKSNTNMTQREMARILNQPDCGYRAETSRKFNADHVKRELRRMFPPGLDVQQVLWHLRDLQTREGWENLDFKPEFTTVAGGMTLKSLHVTMPHADALVEKFGHVVHVDCTFGALIYGHKVIMGGGGANTGSVRGFQHGAIHRTQHRSWGLPLSTLKAKHVS